MPRRRPRPAPVGPMPDAQIRAVVAELTRLCLGGRGPQRFELMGRMIDPGAKRKPVAHPPEYVIPDQAAQRAKWMRILRKINAESA